MTRKEMKAALYRFHSYSASAYATGLDEIEKAIDELIETERAKLIAEAPPGRGELAARFLAILIEKYDGGTFYKALAGRAVAYADELIETLRERKAP